MVAIMLFNPEATLLDLDASGINGDNTGIKEEKEYLKIKEIQENSKFKDINGNFSEAKFHEFYTDAIKNYNTLVAGWQPVFHENNIFAPAKQRRTEPAFAEVTIENPFQRTSSFKDLGEWGPQTKSVREIAEGQKVYNTETGEWMDSPEASFFGTIGMGPLVLASWDFDADENGNPTKDPDKVVHKKGDYKLNDNGTFYYETLGGRSSVGKQILHFSDIITKEDSKWNKIDFLDSDDLEKSVMGTVAKNIALVGSLFIPGPVGYAVTAATLLQQSLKLGATLGKMLLGSDNYEMNNFQAFMSATDLHESKSDYALNKTWCWENLINTAGDAIAQLRQQRVLFETVPWALGYGKLGKGEGLFSAKGQEALKEQLINKHSKILLEQRKNLSENPSVLEFLTQNQELRLAAQSKALKEANDITEGLSKLSGAVSKAYMTGITVNDMFDEAREAGMSDFGAMAMTLGYAAAEYALLSTGIGEMILPELRANRAMTRQLLGKVSEKTKQAFNKLEAEATSPQQKENFFWRAFNAGKKLYQDNRAGLGGAMLNASVGAVGEGVEEVTEEFLADAFRTMADLAHWTDTDMLKTDNILDRYGMNFIGGLIGGGVNGLNTDFSAFKRINNMTSEQAMKELIYKINNGDLKEIMNSINNNKWGNTNLSDRVIQEENGNYVYAQAENQEDSQDEAIKTMLRNQIKSIVDVLEANGARISNPRLFDINTLKDSRFAMLANTSTSGRYSEEFADIIFKIVKNANDQREEDSKLNDEEKRDQSSEKFQTYKRNKDRLEKERKELVEQLDYIKTGKAAAKFIETALIEIHPAISQMLMTGPTLDMFVRRMTNNKKTFRDLSDEEKTQWIEKYKTYKSTSAKDEAIQAYNTWEYIMDAIQKNFAPSVNTYEKEQDKYSQFLDKTYEYTEMLIKNPNLFFTTGNILSGFFDVREASDLATGDQKKKLVEAIEAIEQNIQSRQEALSEISQKEISQLKETLKLYDKSDEELIKQHDDQISIQQTELEKDGIEQINKLKEEYDKNKQQALSLGTYVTEEAYDAANYGKLNEEITKQQEKTLKRQEELEKQKIVNMTEQQLAQLYNETVLKIKQKTSNLQNNLQELNRKKDLQQRWKMMDYLINYIDEISQSIVNSGYLNPITKSKLERMSQGIDNLIKIFTDYQLQELGGGDMSGNYNYPLEQNANDFVMATSDNDPGVAMDKSIQMVGEIDLNFDEKQQPVITYKNEGKLQKIQKQIQDALKTKDSPALELLDQFALDVTGEQTNFSSLLSDINALIDATKYIDSGQLRTDTTKVDLQNLIPRINQAERLVNLLYSVLMGARADSAGFDTLEELSSGTPQFQLYFGINSIINEVREKVGESKKLLTIEGKLTDNIVKDLHLVSKNIQFLKNLYAINSGQKLATQGRIRLRTTQLIYKALKRLYDVAPDDPDDPERINKSALDSFFEEGNILLQHKDDIEVDDQTLEQIEKERINLENALYQFGQDNEGKNFINFAELQDVFNKNSLILNEASEEIDISSLISYIASRMAIKADDFYNTYKDVISEKIAPLAIQELGIYLHTANALNGNKISEIINQVRNNAISWYKGLNQEARTKFWEGLGYGAASGLFAEDIMTPYMANLMLPIPNLSNVTFVEGIAGSGKTRAIMKVVKELISATAPDLLKNAYIVDTSNQNASKLGEALGLEENQYIPLSRESLLEKISNWTKPSIDPKTGDYIYQEGKDFTIDSEGNLQVSYNFKEGIEIPKLIVIDEVGRYTDLELKLIDNFAQLHGISVLTFGDLDQSRTRSSFDIKIPGLETIARKHKIGDAYKNDIFNVVSNIERTQIFHGPKLGFSMRTRNIQQDKNQNLMQEKLISKKGDIMFSYYEGEENGEYILDGAKVINHSGSDYDQKVEEVLQIADKLIKKLQPKEKLGFIYQSKDSKLYKTLRDRYGEDKIEFYYKNSAQGKEARYFIYETDFDSTYDTESKSTKLIEELNTGITRAQDGIIILTKNPNTNEFFGKIGNLEVDKTRKLQELPADQVAEFSTKQKAMYQRILEGRTGKLTYTERTNVSLSVPDNTPPTFKVISVQTQDKKVTVNVEPVDLGTNNWLKGKRGDLNKIVYLTSNESGANVKIGFEKEDGSIQEIEYDGNLLDLVQVDLPEPITADELDPPETVIEETKKINKEERPIKPTPPPEAPETDEEIEEKLNLEKVSAKQRREHTTASSNDKMPINLYTNASVETGGWVRADDGTIAPINGRISDLRIDSMNGLMKLLGIQDPSKYKYDDLYEKLLSIHEIFLSSDTRDKLNERLQKYITNTLGIAGNVRVQFGLWTSPNGEVRQNQYAMYNRTSDEEADFDWIDTGDKTLSSRTIAALISVIGDDGKIKKMMIPIAYMTSPLTRMQDLDDNGNFIYPEALKHFPPGRGFDEGVRELLNDPIVYTRYPALYNLFKLYHFTHSGFFPFMQQIPGGDIQFGWNHKSGITDVFNLRSSLSNYGIQIFKNRGERQLDKSQYQTHTTVNQSYVITNTWNKDERLHRSGKVYMFKAKDSKINIPNTNSTRDVINGRPFILVSEKSYISDEEMYNDWLNGVPGVKLVYLLPPILTLQEYMDRTIKFIEDPDTNPKPGNDTTSFHILNELRKSNLTLLKDKLNKIHSQQPQKVDEIINLLIELDELFERGKANKQQNPNQRLYAEFIEKITEIDSDGNTINKKLDTVLRRLVDKHSGTYNPLRVGRQEHTTELDIDMINQISSALEGKCVIFDRIRFNPNNSVYDLSEDVREIKSDSGQPYRVNGNYLLMDCRVTPPTFGTQELNGFIDSVVNKHIHVQNNPNINSTTENTQMDPKLHKEFIRDSEIKEGNGGGTPEYTPSKNYNDLIEHISSLSTTINYGTPRNQIEEDMEIKSIIDLINSDNKIKEFIYIDSTGKLRFINYSENTCLNQIEGDKKYSGNVIELGGKIFDLEINGDKVTFTERINSETQSTTEVLQDSDLLPDEIKTNEDVEDLVNTISMYMAYADDTFEQPNLDTMTVKELKDFIYNFPTNNIQDLEEQEMLDNLIRSVSDLLDGRREENKLECNKVTLDIRII